MHGTSCRCSIADLAHWVNWLCVFGSKGQVLVENQLTITITVDLSVDNNNFPTPVSSSKEVERGNFLRAALWPGPD